VRGFPPRLAAVLAATVLLAAGCGGTKTYTVEATRACLVKAGVDVTGVSPADLVATTAEGGAFTAHFRDNKVTVSFGLDRKGAEQIVRRYQRFRGKNIGLEDVLRPKQNAVMLWALHPADAYLQTIEACLK
jgi:D-alanyl-D-alanine dipeptidase